MFNTYIEDKAMIPVLLAFDWMVSHLSLIHISEPTRPS